MRKKGEWGMSKTGRQRCRWSGALKQVQVGRKVEDLAREVGMSKHALYAGKAEYSGEDKSQA